MNLNLKSLKVPRSIWDQNKPDKLTLEEYRHIVVHPQVGARIVRPLVNERVVEIIEHHHDSYYSYQPDQVVAGEDIPLGARIVAVADAFDAMTSDRPYQKKMDTDYVVSKIQGWSGTRYDPIVIKAFLRVYKKNALLTSELETKELEKTQARNLHIEKMASLGQLSATVAHELNNPISGILTYSKLIQKKISKDNLDPDEKSSILKYLKMIAATGMVLYTVQPNEAKHNHMGF